MAEAEPQPPRVMRVPLPLLGRGAAAEVAVTNVGIDAALEEDDIEGSRAGVTRGRSGGAGARAGADAGADPSAPRRAR